MYHPGLQIVPNRFVRDIRTEFKVIQWRATRDKKRKNWRVLKIEINRPGCYRVGDMLFMHPDLIAKLPIANRAAAAEYAHSVTRSKALRSAGFTRRPRSLPSDD